MERFRVQGLICIMTPQQWVQVVEVGAQLLGIAIGVFKISPKYYEDCKPMYCVCAWLRFIFIIPRVSPIHTPG